MERNVLKERLRNKDDKNRHFMLLIIDISKHGAKEKKFKEKLSEIRGWGQADRHFAAHYRLFLN
jgi:hypothetical protein